MRLIIRGGCSTTTWYASCARGETRNQGVDLLIACLILSQIQEGILANLLLDGTGECSLLAVSRHSLEPRSTTA